MNRLGWCVWAGLLMTLASVGLGNLIAPGSWLTGLVLIIAVMALVGLGLQWLARRWPRVLQTALIVAVLCAMAAWRTVLETASPLMTANLWPTRASIGATARSIGNAATQVFFAVPPVDAETFACLAFVGLGALTSVVVAGAVVWRSAPLVIIGSLVPWGVVVSMRWDTGPTWPIVCGLAILAFVIWHGMTSRRDAAPGASAAPGVLVVAAALACTLVATTAVPGLPSWGNGRAWLQSLGQGLGQNNQGQARGIGVDGPIDVNANLLNPSPTPRLHVTGTYNGPLVVATYTDFSDNWWRPTPPNPLDQMYAVDVGSVLWDDTNVPPAAPMAQNTTLTFPNWTSATVPLPTGRRTLSSWVFSDVNGTGPGTFDMDTDTLTANYTPLTNQSIELDIDVLDRTTLSDDYTTTPPNSADAQASLSVPQTAHTADLRALANQLTAGAATDYDKLMAIQNYLTSGQFTYSLTPDNSAPSDDAVWDFLQRRSGYCVQFATAMIILGRLAGIPMRAAAGYTTPSSGTGDITDGNAHMWPQAYFATAGWVDFEPTPGGAGDAVPPPPTTATREPTLTPTENSATHTSPAPQTSGPSSSPSATHPSATAPGVPWFGLLGGLAVVAVLAIALVARMVYTGKWTADRAWDNVTKAGRRRRLLTAGATPGAVAARLGHLLPDDAKQQLDDLATTVEQTRYAPGSDAPPGKSRHWHDVQSKILRGLRTDLRHGRREA